MIALFHAFDEALELEGARIEPLLNAGLSLFQLRRFEESRDRLGEVLDLDDEQPQAHYLLGILYMDYLGDAQRAIQHLERYRELDGDDRRVGDWLRRLR